MPYTRALARLLRRITSFHASKAVPSVVCCLCYVRNLHWIFIVAGFSIYWYVLRHFYCHLLRYSSLLL